MQIEILFNFFKAHFRINESKSLKLIYMFAVFRSFSLYEEREEIN